MVNEKRNSFSWLLQNSICTPVLVPPSLSVSAIHHLLQKVRAHDQLSAIHGVIAAPSPSAYLYNIEAHMENLSLHDAGPQGQPGPQQMGQQQQTLGMPPPVPQLPPQMFTTAAQLLDLTDSEFVM